MTEEQVGFLFKSASTLASKSKENSYMQLLRSYYLMRCKEITKGYGLPRQKFSMKKRCLFCCLEWTNKTATKVKPLELSKRKRRRVKKRRNKNLLYSNKLVKTCTFCKRNNVMIILKPKSEDKLTLDETVHTPKIRESKRSLKKTDVLKPVQKNKHLNVYSKTKDVFSLSNKNNILPSTIKQVPKVIKNNKKRKDKFAGLCKQAVLASAKLKEKREKQDNLSLFLKPCT